MRMRALCSLILLLGVAACSTEPATPDLTAGVRTVTVERPVMVTCIREADIPAPPATAMPDPSADVKRLAAGASIDLRQEIEYAARLRAALVACSQPTGGKP